MNDQVFYKAEYRDLTMMYFEIKYKQEKNESRDNYFKRILTKRADEPYDLYEARIKYLKKFMPSLECWDVFELVKDSETGYRFKKLLVSK